MKGNIGIEGSFANVYFLLLVLSKNCLASLDCFIPFSDCSCQNTGKDDSSKLKKKRIWQKLGSKSLYRSRAGRHFYGTEN